MGGGSFDDLPIEIRERFRTGAMEMTRSVDASHLQNTVAALHAEALAAEATVAMAGTAMLAPFAPGALAYAGRAGYVYGTQNSLAIGGVVAASMNPNPGPIGIDDFGATISKIAPNIGRPLYWHGSAEAVEAATRSGLFAHGTGNGLKFWATSIGRQGGLTEILIGGNRNIVSRYPFLSPKGGFSSVYQLTAEEASHFNRAWGFRYSFNPYQWYKGATGQYYCHPGSVSWAQRRLEFGRGLGITGAGLGGAYIVDGGIHWWNRE